MRAMFEPYLGETGALIAQILVWTAIALIVIAIVAWAFKRFSGFDLGSMSRGRVPRLAIVDAVALDNKRRLVLLRRDNLEHLILIGGPTDLVIETSIERPQLRQATAGAGANPEQHEQTPAGAIAIRQVEHGQPRRSGAELPAAATQTSFIPPQPVVAPRSPEPVSPPQATGEAGPATAYPIDDATRAAAMPAPVHAPEPLLEPPAVAALTDGPQPEVPEPEDAVPEASVPDVAERPESAAPTAPESPAQTPPPAAPEPAPVPEAAAEPIPAPDARPSAQPAPVAVPPSQNQPGQIPVSSAVKSLPSDQIQTQPPSEPAGQNPFTPPATRDENALSAPSSAPDPATENRDDTVGAVGELEREMARLLGEADPKQGR